MKKKSRKTTASINPGKLAEQYLKQTIEQLLTALDKGDTDTAGAALVQLVRIDNQRSILGAKIGPAIEKLKTDKGIDFNSMKVPTSLDDEALDNERLELMTNNLVIGLKREITELGPRWAQAQAGNPDETFGEDMQKMGARLLCAGAMMGALGILHGWIETSPDAAWHRTLPPAKKDDEGPGQAQFWKA